MGILLKDELSENVKKTLRGFFSSLIVALIYITHLVILFYPPSTLLTTIILLIITLTESFLLFIIYFSYKILTLNERIFKNTGKTGIFLKGYLWYVLINTALQISRTSLLLVLASNIIIEPETVSNMIYLINILSSFTLAPLTIYLIIWVLMLYIAVKEFTGYLQLKHVLTVTAILMLASMAGYIIYSTAGIIIMITALILQAYWFLEASKTVDKIDREPVKKVKKTIRYRRLRKS